MRPLSSRWAVLVVSLVLVGMVSAAPAQDADADRARALLDKGVSLYKDLKFDQAKATLLKVQGDKLPADRRKVLDGHLGKVDEAIKQQAAAMEAYQRGRKAMDDGKLAEAIKLFERTEQSKFVPAAMKKSARAQKRLAAEKIKARAAAAGEVEPTVPVKPKPKTTQPRPQTTQPKPKAKPQPKPKPAPDPDARIKLRMQELSARIERAKGAIAKGNAALDAERFDEAITHFERAAKIAPEYEPARERLEFARTIAGGGEALRAIGRLEKKRRIRRQELMLRYNKAIQRSREALHVAGSAEGFAEAAEEARYARTLVGTNKTAFADAQFRQMRTETDKLLEFIETSKLAWERRQAASQAVEIEQTRRKREADDARRRRERIATLKVRVRALRKEQKYDRAVEVLGQIRTLDPDDEWAAEWHGQLERFVLLLDAKQARRTSMREEVRQLVGIRWAEVPWYELLRYPGQTAERRPLSWKELTLKRKPFGAGEVAESEADRLVRKRLRATLPELKIEGIAFKDVVQLLSDLSDTNIFVKWNALTAVGIDKTAPVNVKLTNVSFEKALKTILEDVGGATAQLSFIVNEGVITISTKDDLDRETYTRVYDIRDMIVRVPMFAGPDIDIQSAGNNAGNNATTGTGGTGGLFGNDTTTTGTNNATGEGEEEVPTRAELVDSILTLVRDSIASDTWKANSGTIGSLSELNGQLVVTQTAENHRSLLDLLSQLREARALQINIEARFITVSSGFLNRVGIDLDFYFNIGSTLARQDDGSGAQAFDPMTGAKLVQAGPRVTQWTNRQAFNNQLVPLPLHLGSYEFTSPGATALPGSIGGGSTGSALTIAGTFLDDIQVDFLITATEAHQATRTLTAPRVTIFNGQRAYVTVAQQQAYVSGSTPVVSENATAYQPQVSTVATGTVLDVEGTVSADRRYVTMTMRPTVSTINGFTEYQGALDADGNPIPGSGRIQLPNITVQRVECTVSVPDGGTLLLGGQRLAGEVEKEMGVPIISRIPVLNRAFTNRSIVRDETTLLILVKPKIIIQREYEEAAFPP